MTNPTLTKRLLPGILMIITGGLWAQIPSTMPKVTPPSPNAEAFSKYGNVPVSTYTGVPNISIPLFEINIRDIKVPITLSYHASGIKVADEASHVGLGWVLNAGGIISRNIINRDDWQDNPNAFLNPMNTSPAIPQGTNFPPAALVQGGSIYRYYSTESSQSSTPINIDLSQFLIATGIDPFFKPYDFDPDQYNYNFLGYSGKFILNKSREIILEKQEKIRIKPLTVDGAAWEITTPDGFVYKFLDFEDVTDSELGFKSKTAWYLSEIISPQNEHVKFFYTPASTQRIVTAGSFYEKSYPHVLSCSNFNCTTPPRIRQLSPGKEYSDISLDRIEWSQGKIKFNFASDRQDIEGDKRITSMQIFKKDASLPYEEVVFSHDYFVSAQPGFNSQTEFPTPDVNKAMRRLKLKGLTKRSLPVNAQPEQYVFSYYEPTYLPPKNSFARDHWGYFNGRNGNTSLLPTYQTVESVRPSFTDILGVMGIERDPSAPHIDMLSLKSITYPTKGTTTFYYSANEYEWDVTTTPPPYTGPESYSKTVGFVHSKAPGVVDEQELDLSDMFINSRGESIPVIIKGAFLTNDACIPNGGSLDAYIELFTKDNLSVSRATPNTGNCGMDEHGQIPPNSFGARHMPFSSSFVGKPEKYKWKAFIPAAPPPPSSPEEKQVYVTTASAMYTYWVDAKKTPPYVPTPDGSMNKFRVGGGLRISKIEDYDPETAQKVNVRKYEYRYKADTDQDGVMETHSYGRRMVQPEYSYYDVRWEKVNGGSCTSCYSVTRDSGHPQANYNDTPVAYDKVIEYFGENNENGYTEYEYENIENVVKNYRYHTDNIPIEPPFSNTIKNPGNGNLKRQTHFSASGTKLMMTENFYTLKYSKVNYGLSTREIPGSKDFTEMGDDTNMIRTGAGILLLSYETLNSNFKYLSETVTTSYLPTETAANRIRTQYFYDNPAHLQLSKKITFESNLHQTITSYTYPADYTDVQSTAAIKSMKGEKFMHGLPIETTIFDMAPDGNQKIKHREFTVYDNFGTFTFPKEKVTLESSMPLSPSQAPSYIPANTFNAQLYKKAYALDYNSFGNLKKVQKTNDLLVSYLWGHGETLPIAEIKNGSAEASFFTSFEEDGDLSTDVSGINIARTGVKVKTASTYTFPAAYAPTVANTVMSYWYWQNNQWNFSGVIPFQRTITTSGSRLDEIRAFAKGAQMTTFTHLPLVGISSQTDVNNTTINYEYDEMGRLKFIRDNDKRILKTYEYNYKQ